jgi:hypothetical protein
LVAPTVALLAAHGTAATRIGQIEARHNGLRLRTDSGVTNPIEPRGWDHLRTSDRDSDPTTAPANDAMYTRQRDEQ